MEKSRFSIIFAALLAALLSLSSCKGIDGLSISSYNISSIIPASDGFDVKLELGIGNRGSAIKVSDISGNINAKGKPMAAFTADEFVIPRKSDSTCLLKIHLQPDPGQTIMSLLKLRSLSADDFTLDAQAKVKYACLPGKKISREGVCISSLIDRL